MYGNRAGRATLDELADAAGRDPRSIQITVFGAPTDPDAIKEFEEAGAQRAIVALPDTRNEGALAELERMAERVLR